MVKIMVAEATGKGREWNRIVWLQTGPSPYARKDWELTQEANDRIQPRR